MLMIESAVQIPRLIQTNELEKSAINARQDDEWGFPGRAREARELTGNRREKYGQDGQKDVRTTHCCEVGLPTQR